MNTQIHIIKKQQLITSKWSGGTTTQLLIYPPQAQYGNRDFLWRLSSARVEVEESEFTHLPGYERILMIIDGELQLQHEGHHSTTLLPFEQDTFMGEWTTKAYGRVTDFNLMMGKGCEGKLEAVLLPENKLVDVEARIDEKFENITEAFYIVKGKARIQYKDKSIDVSEGDLIYIDLHKNEIFEGIKLLGQSSECAVIRARINY